MKVLLVCAGGMSTSILMKKLEKHAADKGIDFEIAAVGLSAYKDVCANYDCILMGTRRMRSPKAPAFPSRSSHPRITAWATVRTSSSSSTSALPSRSRATRL